MVDVPEYNLNEPFKLVKPENDEETDTGKMQKGITAHPGHPCCCLQPAIWMS